ncbi:MAG: hypothetical protein Q4A16_05485 [Lautropia sp.]|nr:hypothetical protein [Lautropia sp.]
MPQAVFIPVAKVDVSLRAERLLLSVVLALMAAAWWLDDHFNLLWLTLFILSAWGLPRLLHGAGRARRAAQQAAAVAPARGSRRFDPDGLCAQCASPRMRRPVELALADDGVLYLRWVAGGGWVVAEQLRALPLGPLVYLHFVAPLGVTARDRDPSVPQACAVLNGSGPPVDPVVATEKVSGLVQTPAAHGLDMSRDLVVGLGGDRAVIDDAGQPSHVKLLQAQSDGLESGTIAPTTETSSASTDSGPSALKAGVDHGSACAEPMSDGSCLLWIPRLPAQDAAALRRWLLWKRRGGHEQDRDASSASR